MGNGWKWAAATAMAAAALGPSPTQAQDQAPPATAPAVQVATATDTAAAQAALTRAVELYDARQYAAALPEFDKALAGGLRDGRTLSRAGHCQKAAGRSPDLYRATLLQAIAALDPLVVKEAQPAELQDHYFLIAAYKNLGDSNASSRLGLRAVAAHQAGAFGDLSELSPADAVRLAEMAGAAGDRSLQVTALESAAGRIAASQPRDDTALARAYSALGQVHVAAGSNKEARDVLEKVMAVSPGYPGARRAYAQVLYRQGDYSGAAEHWRELRHEDAALATEAIYVQQLMRTLSQKVLLDASRPLDDLSQVSKVEMEDRIIATAAAYRELAVALPKVINTKGFADVGVDDDVRQRTRALRDAKYRLAWLAAAYTDAGHPIREFAFTRGFQSALRAWRLPKERGKVKSGPLPDWLSDEERARFTSPKGS